MTDQDIWNIAVQFAGTQLVAKKEALVFETPQEFADCFCKVIKSVSVTAARVAQVTLADFSTGYNSGILINNSNAHEGATLSLHYDSMKNAENAFNAITSLIDERIAKELK